MLSKEEQINPAYTNPTPKLLFELWELILQHLVPSQLTTLAQTSELLNQNVRGLSVWQVIWNTVELSTRQAKSEHQDFYKEVMTFSERICESCYCYFSIIQLLLAPRRERKEELLKISPLCDTRKLCKACDDTRTELWQRRQDELESYPKGQNKGQKMQCKFATGAAMSVHMVWESKGLTGHR
ncbi:hypothetical protein BJV82DRAFT_665903 [Fennellomyces sp. T-0311]|nr:hypothetical protein BJV82DRAFT_665903 [Fennellomyces sp. T-0311]